MNALKSGTVLFLATLAGSVANCIFQAVMSRSLSMGDFGSLNALFSIIFIAGVPAAATMPALSKEVFSLASSGRAWAIPSLYRRSLLHMALFGGALFVLLTILRKPVSEFLGFGSDWLVSMTGAGLFFAFVLSVNLGLLQGLRRSSYFGAGMGFLSPLRLASGYGLAGAVAGLVLSVAFVFLLTTLPLLTYLFRAGDSAPSAAIYICSPAALAYALLFAVLTNIDLLMVKHYFPAEEAGLYAAASILGKTVLFLLYYMTQSLFPSSMEPGPGGVEAVKLLDRGLGFVLATALICLPVLVLFPAHVLAFLFGEPFAQAAPVLKLYALAAALMSAVSVFSGFSLARRRGFIFPLAAACVLLPFLLSRFHGSMTEAVMAAGGVDLALVLIGLFGAMRERRSFVPAQAKLEGIAGR